MKYLIILFNPFTLLLLYIGYAKTTGKLNCAFKYVGAVVDLIVNLTWATVIFLDVPKELLLTQRIERLKANTGWRGAVAWKLCDLLNYFIKDHCRG